MGEWNSNKTSFAHKKSRVQRLGYRRVSRRVLDEILVEVEQLLGTQRHSPVKERIATDARICPPPVPRTMSGRPSTWPADSVALALGTYAAFCAVAPCVHGLSSTYGVLPSLPWKIRNFVVVPRAPGSSGSPRLISCKVVPSCRNEGRFAQGPPPSLLQIPDAPQVCNAKRNGFPLRGIVATTSQRSRKVKWAGHTRHVASDFMPPASWDDELRGTEGLPSLRSAICHPRLDVLWVMCYGCLPPVCASLDSSAYCVYQDLRLVSPPPR